MKRLFSLVLASAMLLTGCTRSVNQSSISSSSEATSITNTPSNIETSQASVTATTDASQETAQDTKFDPNNFSDPRTMNYIEDNLYVNLVDDFSKEGKYIVEGVHASYISKEYLEELKSNSQPNVYFGYTLQEIDKELQGTRYVFTLGKNGETVLKTYDTYNGEYEKILTNVAIGVGVIVICVVVAVVTDGAAVPAECKTIHAIFVAAAEGATLNGITGGIISGGLSAAIEAYKTGDKDKAVKSGLVNGSKGFSFGCIIGAVTSGASEAIQIYKIAKAFPNSFIPAVDLLKMQRESKYPIELLAQIQTKEEYEVFRNAGLISKTVIDRLALVRNIDLNYVDKAANGLSNLELMKLGKAPFDPATGLRYELHHIGQHADSPFAILTQKEHDSFKHLLKNSEINRSYFNSVEKPDFWKELAVILSKT